MNFTEFMTSLRKLEVTRIESFEKYDKANFNEVVKIRNELSNDGFIYVNHIKPIFSESVTDAIAFFESWHEHAETMDKFRSEL